MEGLPIVKAPIWFLNISKLSSIDHEQKKPHFGGFSF